MLRKKNYTSVLQHCRQANHHREEVINIANNMILVLQKLRRRAGKTCERMSLVYTNMFLGLHYCYSITDDSIKNLLKSYTSALVIIVHPYKTCTYTGKNSCFCDCRNDCIHNFPFEWTKDNCVILDFEQHVPTTRNNFTIANVLDGKNSYYKAVLPTTC